MAHDDTDLPTLVLDTPERLKAISHPLRLGILRLLAEQERTNEELARELKVASGKLYFHTKKLLDVGMIALSTTRQKGPVTEKVYRAAIRGFVSPDGQPGDAFFAAPLQAGLDLYNNTWQEIGDPHGVVAFHYLSHQTPENEALLAAKLIALCDESLEIAVPAGTPGSRPISLLALLHGLTARPPEDPP